MRVWVAGWVFCGWGEKEVGIGDDGEADEEDEDESSCLRMHVIVERDVMFGCEGCL